MVSRAQGTIEEPFWKKGSRKKSIAQGTIEYLVIIAVIVVISLVVVGLVTTTIQSPSTQISSANDKIGNLTTGGISVIDSVTDSGGDSIVKLQNNSGGAITLTKITVGENETSFDEQLVSGDAKSFSLKDLNLSCPCSEGQSSVSCNFTFYLTTPEGLEKKQTKTITTQCQAVVEAANPSQIVGLGGGTLADPWIINSCRELQEINSHLDGNYALGADVNCEETISWNSESGFSPIGLGSSFTGTLNGRDKSILGLYINLPTTEYVGLFSATSEASLTNLNLIDVNIIGQNWVGGFAGEQIGGSISNSYVQGEITGDEYSIGGFFGSSANTSITNSHTSVNLIGTNAGSEYIGGIVGDFEAYEGGTALISNSYSTGDINGVYWLGGLIGYSYVESASSLTISSSYSTGNVTGYSHLGGLIGQQANAGSDSLITNCYATGNIVGYRYEGGLVGTFSSAGGTITNVISNSYSTGQVSGGSGLDLGGFVGNTSAQFADPPVVTNSFWDMNTSTKATSAGATPIGKTTTQMQTASTYSTWNTDVWNIIEGQYPTLK